MKVLIVDDDPSKAADLTRVIRSAGIEEADVRLARSANEARSLLRLNDFELMVLDIILPRRTGDRPVMEGSLELLDDLDTSPEYHRPVQILGVTAFPAARVEALPRFSERLWTIIESGSDWVTPLTKSIRYLQERQKNERAFGIDLCVVTALRNPEMAAVHNLPWNWNPIEPLDDVTFIRRGRIDTAYGSFSVAAASAPRMGMVATALLTSKLISSYRPRFVAMTGICAGIKAKVNIGDVILANPTWDWQNGKRVRDRRKADFFIEPHQLAIPEYIRVRFEELSTIPSIWEDIRRTWLGHEAGPVQLHIGPIASGSAVVADHRVLEQIREQHRKLLGVEMESYGALAAAAMASYPRPTAFAIKSVCDFADSTKSDDYQDYAAFTSAQTLRAFVERYLQEIISFAGRS